MYLIDRSSMFREEKECNRRCWLDGRLPGGVPGSGAKLPWPQGHEVGKKVHGGWADSRWVMIRLRSRDKAKEIEVKKGSV